MDAIFLAVIFLFLAHLIRDLGPISWIFRILALWLVAPGLVNGGINWWQHWSLSAQGDMILRVGLVLLVLYVIFGRVKPRLSEKD